MTSVDEKRIRQRGSRTRTPVAGALQREHVGVVDHAVDHGCGDGLVSEVAARAVEWQVALAKYRHASRSAAIFETCERVSRQIVI